MKTTRTFKVDTTEVVINYLCEMREETSYSDGWNIPLGKKPFESLELIVNKDGKPYGIFSEYTLLRPDKSKYEAELAQKGVVAMTEYDRGKCLATKKETADAMFALIADAKKEARAKEPEYVSAISTLRKKELKEKLEKANEIIESAEKEIKANGKLMTLAEYKIWMKRYNDLNNEGGEGYIPSRITLESYNYAKSIQDKKDCTQEDLDLYMEIEAETLEAELLLTKPIIKKSI